PTSYAYDELGRLVRTTDALSKSRLVAYDGEGLKVQETDRRDVVRTFTYDNLARPRTSAVVPSLSGVAATRTTRYDDRGRQRTETDARSHSTVFDLDGLGRVVRVKDPLGRTVVTRWDGVNKREETDKRGNTTRFD